ncbi:trypco2 family protein [Dactylosporangium sp. NPDC049525]|uniref:trypco2 family protein n=1 Tax=Dactylosporangium sp. NPDC049525 TaxID=3154730 RepID=UPI0034419D11
MGDADDISVAEVIRQLRGDLYYAQWQGEDKTLRFELGPIELEFAVVVDSSRGNGAKAKLWVVDASAESKRSSQHTHRIKLTLQPMDEHGVKTTVAGRPIDGEEVPGSGLR